jgi:hypothetical protein
MNIYDVLTTALCPKRENLRACRQVFFLDAEDTFNTVTKILSSR